MKLHLKIALSVLIIVLLPIAMLAVALYVPNSLHTNSDFLAIYNADLRLLQHIKPYDYQSQIRLMAEQTGMLPENVFMPQFPYPPWYALSTFYLGLLPVQSAATLWFEINLVMLFLTVWFLSADWHPRLRLFSFLAPFFFIPIIGTLGVGQYDFPVLLGSAMLIYAIRHQRLALTSIGAALLTFKPHVGIPIFLAVLLYFFLLHNLFGRRTLVWIFSGMAFLCVISFVTDAAWLIHYPLSLLSYRNNSNVVACSECDSLPVWLARSLLRNPSLNQMALIGLGLFVILIIICVSIHPPLWNSPEYFISALILMILLAIPYLYNYDFILLLIPFALLAEVSRSWFERIFLILLYLFPFFAIMIFGRSIGDPSLLFVTLMLALLVFIHARKLPQLDVSPSKA